VSRSTRTPTVDADRLDGWRLVEKSSETPFDVRMLRVVAHTAVYEDARLRERVRERAGVDGRWRFFLASRIGLTPSPPRSAALERLVADRATDTFERRLGDRGFEGVERTGDREFQVDGSDARLTRFVARCPVANLELDVEAWLAAWHGSESKRGESGGYLVAGGGYPRRVVGDDGRREAVASEFDAGRFREELFELIRATS
jgi:hypothetical protein